MRTKRIILTTAEDRDLGGIGLLLPGMANRPEINPAQDGLTIAHDLFEHQNGAAEIGSITDELEALGGIWFIRGQHGDLRRDGVGSMYTVHENIAIDVTRMFRDAFYGAHVDYSEPKTMPCEADADFKRIIEHFANDYLSEIDDANASDVAAAFARYTSICLPRMRIGYRKASRRFKRDSIAANDLFWTVAGIADSIVTNVEFEGQEFVLTYGFDNNGSAFAHWDEHYSESN